jgi:acyl-CoA hydrolase
METYKLVLPEHLNHYGFLFGGNLLKWIDEIAYIAVTLDYPGCNFVTVGMDKVEFRKSIRGGTILCFVTEQQKAGITSVEYRVNVFRKSIQTGERVLTFSTNITFVCVDEKGKKKKLCRGYKKNPGEMISELLPDTNPRTAGFSESS